MKPVEKTCLLITMALSNLKHLGKNNQKQNLPRKRVHLISFFPSSICGVSTYGGLQMTKSTFPVNLSTKPVKQSSSRTSKWVESFLSIVCWDDEQA